MMPVRERYSREIERVARLCERYTLMENGYRTPLRPAIDLMEAVLEAGHKAAGRNDETEIANVVKQMEGFKE